MVGEMIEYLISIPISLSRCNERKMSLGYSPGPLRSGRFRRLPSIG